MEGHKTNGRPHSLYPHSSPKLLQNRWSSVSIWNELGYEKKPNDVN